MSIYVAWSYPAEAGRDVTVLDNRFSTMTEVRRVQWPAYEDPQWSDPMRFQQGIAGGLELFFWGWLPFQRFVHEATGYPVPVYQRVDQAGFHTPLDERVLADTDTLFVWGLDHMITGQEATPAEIEALREFLTREGTCLALGPHHDVGASDDLAVRDVEYHHHGDALVPRRQRFGRYTRSLMAGLGVPVENRYGLRPAVTDVGRNAPLTIARDLDTRGWLEGVSHFNFHMHLPHYAVTTPTSSAAPRPRNPTYSDATAPTWPSASFTSGSRCSGATSGTTPPARRTRNCWPRRSWGAGAAARRSRSARSTTTPASAPTPRAATPSSTSGTTPRASPPPAAATSAGPTLGTRRWPESRGCTA
ncbi:hypothetical protein [Nonomuraea sp. NPDC052265]|uniref:hypothetical protein n=1 Tax=Nonomuraea sp. NPDC052265 TaxID=3364374 RepID=UPI0037C55025